jgi:AcrR family transcriptional regulator
MTEPPRKRRDEPRTVWERPEPIARPAPVPLSRDAIVRVAIAIADAEGLRAVSLRRVGAALGAGPMRLYGYMSTKDELLDLMVDAIYAEMTPDEAPAGEWRAALGSIARAIRDAATRHPWFVDLNAGRPPRGPNGLAQFERLLAALHAAPGFEDIDVVMQAAAMFIAYVIGAIRRQVGDRRAERESGMDEAESQSATRPYIQRMIATGTLPTLAKVVRDATRPPADVVFEQGLAWVLDGIAVHVARRTPA